MVHFRIHEANHFVFQALWSFFHESLAILFLRSFEYYTQNIFRTLVIKSNYAKLAYILGFVLGSFRLQKITKNSSFTLIFLDFFVQSVLYLIERSTTLWSLKCQLTELGHEWKFAGRY